MVHRAGMIVPVAVMDAVPTEMVRVARMTDRGDTKTRTAGPHAVVPGAVAARVAMTGRAVGATGRDGMTVRSVVRDAVPMGTDRVVKMIGLGDSVTGTGRGPAVGRGAATPVVMTDQTVGATGRDGMIVPVGVMGVAEMEVLTAGAVIVLGARAVASKEGLARGGPVREDPARDDLVSGGGGRNRRHRTG
jgi:hypothetical protein